jgi:tetratricopeptide (TPR) repeat protein
MTSKAAAVTAIPAGESPGLAWPMRSRMRLVDELAQVTVDPATSGPLPGREDEWAMLADYRAEIAQQDRDWPTMEQILHESVNWHREQASPALAASADDRDRSNIDSLAAAILKLANALREQEQPGCVQPYLEAMGLFNQIADRPAEAAVAFNLGNAYLNIPDLRDLDQAERWYRHSAKLIGEHDKLGRARVTGQLGSVALERFHDARRKEAPEDQLTGHLTDASAAYLQALDLLPAHAVTEIAAVKNQLGLICGSAGDPDRALEYYQQSIQLYERQEQPFLAGEVRFNAAITLADAGRWHDALLYAWAALRDYESVGSGASTNASRTRSLIAGLEQHQDHEKDPGYAS